MRCNGTPLSAISHSVPLRLHRMSHFGDILNSYQQKKRRTDAERPSQTADDPAIDRAGLTLPSFYIIGAQKCGTMAAVKNLNQHPDIFVANELHYFDRGWHTKDITWYAAQFAATTKSVLGEKTPELIYVDECAIRMKEVSPDAKFILFLRDPVARAYSGWNMNRSNGRESAPFDECVQRNINNADEIRSYGTGEFHYVQRGFYMDQIERFLRVFPDRSKLHIVISERMRKDAQGEYAKMFSFLGVSPLSFTPEEEHLGVYESAMSSRVAEKLRKLYAPHNERLFAFLGYRVDEWGTEFTTTSNGDSNPVALPSSDLRASNSAESDNSSCTGRSTGTNTEVGPASTRTAADFARIGAKHGTDKVTHHGYHRFYPRFLEHYRGLGAGSAMLEIGVDQSHSLRTWLEYFPQAFVYGLDISISREGDRYRIFKADQSNRAELRRIVDKELKHALFLIVDDGSHVPEHQVACFDFLFGSSALLPGGTYIVEDVETSYWTRGGLYGYTTRFVVIFHKPLLSIS